MPLLPTYRKFRVLVVDDSAYRRQALSSMLENIPGVEVVAFAQNGREALHKCIQLEPDFVTLDIHMPEMDGFTFLRILMHRRPIPVLVISGFASHENVFRALELGAVDFLAAPSGTLAPDMRHIEDELREKVKAARGVQSEGLVYSKNSRRTTQNMLQRGEPKLNQELGVIVAVASSTGGPVALMNFLQHLPPGLNLSMVIAQHMPANFTQSFANRLNRVSAYPVFEGKSGERLQSGTIYLAPGGRHMAVVRGEQKELSLELRPGDDPKVKANHVCPNADFLFQSCAEYFQQRCCAVVLTGMGRDGTRGCEAIRKRGGGVYCQQPSEATVPGMPQSVVDAGLADDTVAIARMGERIESFVRQRGEMSPMKVA